MVTFEKINTAEEIEHLAKFAEKIWNEYFGFIITQQQIDFMVKKFQSPEAIKNQIARGYEYYLIKKDGKDAGYTGVCDKGGHLFLSKLYIEKNFRGQGIGKSALAFLESLYKKDFQLTVNKHNDSTIAVYKKWGFEIIDEVIAEIGEGFVMDDYIMYKKI